MNETFYIACEKLLTPQQIDVTTDPPILFPSDSSILPDIIRLAQEYSKNIRIIGKGTFPAPETKSNVLCISTASLSKIQEVNPEDFIVVTQGGALVDDVTSEVERWGLSLPLDNTSGAESTIGGAYMTGAIGPSAVRYGLFRTAVIGVRCITPSGDRVNFGGRTVKNVTGYDVPWYLWGTLGLFAFVWEMMVKIRPLPETHIVINGQLNDNSRLSHIHRAIVSQVNNVNFCEIIAEKGLGSSIEIAIGFEGAVSVVKKCVEHLGNDLKTLGVDNLLIRTNEQFKKSRREIAKRFASVNLVIASVPPSSTGVYLEAILALSPTLPVLAHAPLGRIHIMCNDDKLIKKLEELTLAFGGKRLVRWQEIYHNGVLGLFGGSELNLVNKLKKELDPNGMFNPGWGL